MNTGEGIPETGEVAALRRLEVANARIERLEDMLRRVLESARPNYRDHPWMAHTWDEAKDVLDGNPQSAIRDQQ